MYYQIFVRERRSELVLLVLFLFLLFAFFLFLLLIVVIAKKLIPAFNLKRNFEFRSKKILNFDISFEEKTYFWQDFSHFGIIVFFFNIRFLFRLRGRGGRVLLLLFELGHLFHLDEPKTNFLNKNLKIKFRMKIWFWSEFYRNEIFSVLAF